MRAASVVVANVLGERRAVGKIWPDGSYSCPFCGAAVIPGQTKPSGPGRPCGNPWCQAGGASAEQVLERRRKENDGKLRRQASKRRADELARWNAEASERRQQQEREVADAGQCLICFRGSGGRRRVRHRSQDFHRR